MTQEKEIQVAAEEGTKSRRRRRSGKDEDVEEALFKWFQYARGKHAPVDGPILCQKAEEIAEEIGKEFKATAGWLEDWQNRHEFCFNKLRGDAAEATVRVAEKSKDNSMQNLLERCTPDEIYNADEHVIYFCACPDSTSIEKKQSSAAWGFKTAKDRLTAAGVLHTTWPVIMKSCSSLVRVRYGSYGARVPFVWLQFPNFQKPRCFKNVHSLPVIYKSSAKAWVTTAIWRAGTRAGRERMRRLP